ncbi:MAG: hypothetical protein JOZ30_04040, partial [Hyphomicrobiales bacterium]|nr:hypothetical protein [Hyphomicrobiales bacterium]
SVGQGGYGIQTSPAQGRLVAALINEGELAEELSFAALVDPARFFRSPERSTQAQNAEKG